MDEEETLALLQRMQKALCKLLIYVNRTADWAAPAQAVAQEAAILLRQHGRRPAEVPGLKGERTDGDVYV